MADVWFIRITYVKLIETKLNHCFLGNKILPPHFSMYVMKCQKSEKKSLITPVQHVNYRGVKLRCKKDLITANKPVS